jgi:protein O-mannosyl-transferase
LSTFFTLLTLLSYTRYVQQSRRSSFWFALLFFTLALLSKPMPVTLPLLMLILDYWPLKRFENYKSKISGSKDGKFSIFKFQLSIVLEKWPLFLLATASSVVTMLAQHNAVSSLQVVPLSFRLENTMLAYVGYLWKMIWPFNLSVFYPLHAPIAWPSVVGSMILLAGISMLVWRERKSSPWLLIGWLWFLTTLLPVIGLVQVGGQAMADRYSYFPLIGIFLGVAFAAQALTGHFDFLKKWFGAAAILILGACVLLTENQLYYWHDSESLFTHAINVVESAPAYLNLGNALQNKNQTKKAMAYYLLSLQFDPESNIAYNDIAQLLNNEDQLEASVFYYQEAVKRKPRSASVYDNFGIVLEKLGRFDEAIKEFSDAMRIDPPYPQPHFLTGRILLQEGHDAEAVEQFRKALQLGPDDIAMLIFTVNVLAADENPLGRNGAAAHAFATHAVELTDGQQPAALDALAMSCAENGQFGEAVQFQQQAIKLIQKSRQKEDLEVLVKRLKLYQSHQPWRESFKKN